MLATLQHLTETNLVFLLVVFFGCILLICLISLALVPSDAATQRRIKLLKQRQNELSSHRAERLLQRKQAAEKISKFAKTVTEKSGLNTQEQISDLAAQLAKAGYRNKNAVFYFTALRMMLLIGLPVITFIGFKIFLSDTDFMSIILACVGLGALGFLMPKIVVDRKARERLSRIKRTFPDAIDMLVVCTEAGLGTDAAIKRVSQEMYTGAPDIAEELAATLIELNFFENRTSAFANLTKRIPLPYTRTFANTMTQTERFGTPIAQSLRILSEEFRKDRMEEAETKASKLATKMVLPIAIFMFLPLLGIIIFPIYLSMKGTGLAP